MNAEAGGRTRRVQVVVIVLVVLAAVGIGYALLRPAGRTAASPPPAAVAVPQPDNTAMVDPLRTRAVGVQIAQTVAQVYSYDAAHLDQHLRDIDPLVTGAARGEVERILNAVRANPAARTAVVTTTVPRFAVTRLHPDRLTGDEATVLVLLAEQARTSQAGPAQTINARLLVTAHQNGFHWQITAADAMFGTPRAPQGSGAVLDHGRLGPVDTARQRDLLLDAAASAAQTLTSADAANPGPLLDRALAVTTGDLHARLTGSRADAEAKIRAGRVAVTSTAVAAGATTLNLDVGSADVLVALNASVPGQPPRPVTVTLALQRVGTQWLVGNVASV